jgi:DNA (cytosine-5)-methyltransferase 1
MFSYDWQLSDLKKVKPNGLKVFSCFSCGGGSSMGYKMAGFDVIGNVEIDPRVNSCYVENLNPKYNYCMDIRKFRELEELPAELYELDILDGSPPCSLFSSANMVADEKKGKKVKFREGQATQVLDDLFFEFIALSKRLQPKVVLAENVKGLLHTKNKWYVEQIYKQLDEAGYAVTHKLLDASNMGVPQKRERVFFMAIRKDLQFDTVDLFSNEPRINLDFKDKKIPFKEVYTQSENNYYLSDFFKEIWGHRLQGDIDFKPANARYRNKPNTGFGQIYVYKNEVCKTLTTKKDVIVLFDEPRYLNDDERIKIGSFPKDYNFLDQPPHYIIGMSVPPLMTYRIALEIKKQWLDKNKELDL